MTCTPRIQSHVPKLPLMTINRQFFSLRRSFLLLVILLAVFFEGCGDQYFKNRPADPPTVAPPPPLEDPSTLALARSALSPITGLTFPPLKGVLEELRLRFPQQPASMLLWSFSEAVSAAVQKLELPATELTCMRDYSLPCPEDWTDLGNGLTCAAPDGFSVEDCKQEEDLALLTVQEKMAFSVKCKSLWPCFNACEQDFTQPCPQGWTLGMAGFCFGPWAYRGPCVQAYSFQQHNYNMRKEWSRICDVAWPCKQPTKFYTGIKLSEPIEEAHRIIKINDL